jgi:hypothetical protein
MGKLKPVILLLPLGFLVIITIQLYYKISYSSIFCLILSFCGEVIIGCFCFTKQSERIMELERDTNDIFSSNKIRGKLSDFRSLIKIDNLNFLSCLWKVFAFLCLPTLLTEFLLFLPIFFLFKFFLSEYLKIVVGIFSFLLLFQLCFWIHEFGHILSAHFSKGISYVVKTPLKYRFFEICLTGGIFNKPEARDKRFLCAIAGPGADLIFGLLFLLLYFYTKITLFYIGFIMNIAFLYINLLPLKCIRTSF